MKILILSTQNPTKTSGIVAGDIYDGLKHIVGNEVKMLVKNWDKYDDKDIITCEGRFTTFKNTIISKIKYKLSEYGIIKPLKSDPNYHIQDYNQTVEYYSTKNILKKVGFTPDVILVLFMQNFLTYKNLDEIGKLTKANIYLMLMDMASYTGICHYAWDCTGYTKQCGKCPALYSDNPDDQSHVNWKLKKEVVKNSKISLIAASEWQVRQIQMSSIYANKPYHKVLLSVNSSIFKPVDKYVVRLKMGLPVNKKIIFFGSTGINHKRKGMYQLLESLKILSQQLKDSPLENNVLLMIAGKGVESISGLLPFEYKYIGMLNGSCSIATAYQAADIFVCPSIEDSGPTMINQSVMCGTPVVSFEMGVALDLVITNKTGYRAKLGDNEDLAYGIKKLLLLESDAYNAMALDCRNLAIDLYNTEKQINELMRVISV